MICEIRLGGGGKGALTMFPGSRHPDGEMVEWGRSDEPAAASCSQLKQACAQIAAGAILLRHWVETRRHELSLRISGLLARVGWEEDRVLHFVGAIATAAHDREIHNRQCAVRDTFEKFAAKGQIYGLPALVELIGEDAAKQIAKLIEYQENEAGELLERMNEKFCVVPVNGKVRVLTREKERGRSVLVFFTFEDFKKLLDHNRVKAGNRSVGSATWWLNHADRRQYDGLTFEPGAPQVIENRLNLWQDWGIAPRAGSWRLIMRHIWKVLANRDRASFKYILRWTAWALQNPNKPAEVALVFRGNRGTGRGLFGRMLKDVFGQHGLHISSRDHLTGRFNRHMMDCAMLFADEAYWPGDKQAEGTLKHIITEDTLPIEPKGIDTFQVTNALKLIIASNEQWVVPAGHDERRFAVFKVGEQLKQRREYFAPLYREIENGGVAAMMHDLLAMDLRGWHPRDDVPQTDALAEQKLHSLSAEDQWWLGLLESGELPGPVKLDDPRLAVSSALFEDARKNAALRYYSDHRLSNVLKRWKCDRSVNHRINGKRAWQLPELCTARENWDSKMGGRYDWADTKDDTEQWKEWSHPDAM